jgi:hypothetical protein
MVEDAIPTDIKLNTAELHVRNCFWQTLLIFYCGATHQASAIFLLYTFLRRTVETMMKTIQKFRPSFFRENI